MNKEVHYKKTNQTLLEKLIISQWDKIVEGNLHSYMWSKSWILSGGFAVISINFAWNIGWTINNIDLSNNIWNITIAPFLHTFGTTLGLADYKGGYFSNFFVADFYHIEFPITLTYDDEYEICYQMDMHIFPTHINDNLQTAPASCSSEIFDYVYNSTMHLPNTTFPKLTWTKPEKLMTDLIDFNFTSEQTSYVVKHNCVIWNQTVTEMLF